MTSYGPIGAIHVHSSYSHDGRDTLAGLHAWAAGRGIGFVGLTDHAEDFDPARFARFVAECAERSDDRVRLLPGLEFRFEGLKGMHLLVLGLDRWMAPTRPAECLAVARDAGAFSIVAHPVLPRYRIPDDVLAAVDAIEIWNASYNTRYLPDPEAMRLLKRARRHRAEIVGTAGLDQHDSRNDRAARVLLDRAAADPLAELRAGRFVNFGATMRFGPGGLHGPALVALSTVRFLYDGVERTQEHLTRWLRRRS